MAIIADSVTVAGVPVNGVTVNAYLASRCAGGATPAFNASPPGGAADGTAVTGTGFGGAGEFEITVGTTGVDYCVSAATGPGLAWKRYTVTGATAGVTTLTAGANVQVSSSSGNITVSAAESALLVPTGYYVESMPRVSGLGSDITPLVAGQMTLSSVTLVATSVVATIQYTSGTVGSTGTLTHAWFVLYDKNGNALAVTGDDTSAAWAANTTKTLTISNVVSGGSWVTGTSYTIPTSDIYYVGVMVAGGTTRPTLIGAPLSATAAQFTPYLAVQETAHTGLLAPTTAPIVATYAANAPTGFPYFTVG